MFKEVCEFTTNVDFKHFRTLVDMVAVEYYTKKEMKSMDKKMKLELYKPKVDPNFWKVPEKFMKHKKKELDKDPEALALVLWDEAGELDGGGRKIKRKRKKTRRKKRKGGRKKTRRKRKRKKTRKKRKKLRRKKTRRKR